MADKNKKFKLPGKKGFTLIEVVVVMAVFLFIIGAAIAIFISIIQHQRRILSEQQALNQISYIQEYMSKAMRMAKKDETGTCLIDSGGTKYPGYIFLLTNPNISKNSYWGIKFINQSDNDSCQEFFLDNAVHGDASTPIVLKELKNSTNISNAIPLSSDKILINSVKFSINGEDGTLGGSQGASDADNEQPRVTIVFNIKIISDSQQPNRIFQTTVSQRNLNAQ